MIPLPWNVIEELAVESSVFETEAILDPWPIGVDAVVLNSCVVMNSHYSFGGNNPLGFRILLDGFDISQAVAHE